MSTRSLGDHRVFDFIGDSIDSTTQLVILVFRKNFELLNELIKLFIMLTSVEILSILHHQHEFDPSKFPLLQQKIKPRYSFYHKLKCIPQNQSRDISESKLHTVRDIDFPNQCELSITFSIWLLIAPTSVNCPGSHGESQTLQHRVICY